MELRPRAPPGEAELGSEDLLTLAHHMLGLDAGLVEHELVRASADRLRVEPRQPRREAGPEALVGEEHLLELREICLGSLVCAVRIHVGGHERPHGEERFHHPVDRGCDLLERGAVAVAHRPRANLVAVEEGLQGVEAGLDVVPRCLELAGVEAREEGRKIPVGQLLGHGRSIPGPPLRPPPERMTDDEDGRTSLSGVDVYPDVLSWAARIKDAGRKLAISASSACSAVWLGSSA